jgi:hypothetical protein
MDPSLPAKGDGAKGTRASTGAGDSSASVVLEKLGRHTTQANTNAFGSPDRLQRACVMFRSPVFSDS